MFKNSYQGGLFSLLYSIGSKPLQLWDSKARSGHIKRVTDTDINSFVLEVEGTNVSTTYISCPPDPRETLGIERPFFSMIVKNLQKDFTFEVQVLDDTNVRRRIRASTYRRTMQVRRLDCSVPLRLDDGWNHIRFNLADFTNKAFGTNYRETLRVQIHANCCLRRVYFSDRVYSDEELPAQYKLPDPNQKARTYL